MASGMLLCAAVAAMTESQAFRRKHDVRGYTIVGSSAIMDTDLEGDATDVGRAVADGAAAARGRRRSDARAVRGPSIGGEAAWSSAAVVLQELRPGALARRRTPVTGCCWRTRRTSPMAACGT